MIADFNQDTITLTGKEVAETTITVTAEGVKDAEIKVTVKDSQEVPDLNTLVTVTNLEELKNNKTDTILEKVIDFNPRSANKISIKEDSITNTGAIIIPATNEYTGEVSVEFVTNSVFPDLKELVTTTYLGQLNDDGLDTILKAVENQNPEAIGKIVILQESITNTTAKVFPSNNETYTGFVTVSFWFESKIPLLSSIVPNRDLGNLSSNTWDVILKEIENKNPKTREAIEIESVDETNVVTIVAKDEKKYEGKVELWFIIGDLTDQDVVNAINFSSYFTTILVNTKIDDLNQKINPDFIKRNILNGKIKDFFKNDLFKLNNIMKDESNNLTDEDLKEPNLRLESKINYNYGQIHNQNVNLAIQVQELVLPISNRRKWALERLKAAEVGTGQRKFEWLLYLTNLNLDLKSKIFELTNQELDSDQMIQKVFYEQIKLMIETDLAFFEIEKDYSPSSAELNIRFFEVIREAKQIIEVGELELEILQNGVYVPITQEFLFEVSYKVIDEEA